MFAALLSALASNDFMTRAIGIVRQHVGLGRLSRFQSRLDGTGVPSRSRCRRATVTDVSQTRPAHRRSAVAACLPRARRRRPPWPLGAAVARRLPRPAIGPLAAAVPMGIVASRSASRTSAADQLLVPVDHPRRLGRHRRRLRRVVGGLVSQLHRPTPAHGGRTMFNVAMMRHPRRRRRAGLPPVGGVGAPPVGWASPTWSCTWGCRSSSPTSSAASSTRAPVRRRAPRPGHPVLRLGPARPRRLRSRLRRLRRHRLPLRHPLVPRRARRVQCAPRPGAAARGPVGLHPVRRGAALARTDVETLVTALGTKEPAGGRPQPGRPLSPSGSLRSSA